MRAPLLGTEDHKMAERTVYFSIHSSGNLVQDVPGSTRETCVSVHGVPADISTARVMNHLSHLAFWPWPKSIEWADVADKARGSIIRPSKAA